jgi:hypothetical protein
MLESEVPMFKSKPFMVSITFLTISIWGSVHFCQADENSLNVELAADRFNSANKIYHDGEKNLSRLTIVEQKLMEALRYIPEDRTKICYKVKKIIYVPGPGFEPVKKFVQFTECSEYYPNRLIGEIRCQIPPEPWAVVEIIEKQNKIRLSIENKGQSKMENFQIIPSAGLKEKTIDVINPETIETVSWYLSDAEDTLSFSFKEKYNYVPLSITLER